MKKNLLALKLFFMSLSVLAQQEAITSNGEKVILYANGTWSFAVKETTDIIIGLEIPFSSSPDIIKHTGYSLSYNEEHEQANWIAYELTKDETKKLFERTDKFLIDPKVKTYSATDNDYYGSGYDRGHLAPAADMGWSSTAMEESFYYSNMSPQNASFNRGIWKRLEALTRSWAIEIESIYIVTGGVLTKGLPTIGVNMISVPKYFYKVILSYSDLSIEGIGFILPNSGSSLPLETFSVSIDSVEKFTGLNFFPLLPDDIENKIELEKCIPCWTWKPISGENTGGNSVQCSGITKIGNRCKNKTLNPSGKCYIHTDQNENKVTKNKPIPQKPSASVQCSGTTKAGNRCKRKTLSTNGRCYQHKNKY